MAQTKLLNIAPIALGNAAANLLNCNISSLTGPVGFTMTQPYLIVKHIRVVNNDNAASHTVKLFKGVTGGSAVGTEFAWAGGYAVAASQAVDWYGEARFDAADFLTGFADTANKLTLNIDAHIAIA